MMETENVSFFKASIIQYGYRKCGTRAREFLQTLAHGNSKNEIKQRIRRRLELKKRGVSMERSTAGTKKKS